MSADLVWGWATFGFALMVPATLWLGHSDRRLLAGASVWAKPFHFALSLAIFEASDVTVPIAAALGHSLGEYTALAAVGILDRTDAQFKGDLGARTGREPPGPQFCSRDPLASAFTISRTKHILDEISF